MSHFYADISGSARTKATRCGTINSGGSGHIRGWGAGVQVHGARNIDGADEFRIFATHGSSGSGRDRYLGVVVLDSEGNLTFDDGE